MINILLCVFIQAEIRPDQLEQGVFENKTVFRTVNDQPFAGVSHANAAKSAADFLSVLEDPKKLTKLTVNIPQTLKNMVHNVYQASKGLVVDFKNVRVYLDGVKEFTTSLQKSLEYYHRLVNERRSDKFVLPTPQQLAVGNNQQGDEEGQIWQVHRDSLESEAQRLAEQAKKTSPKLEKIITEALENFITSLQKLQPGQSLPELKDFEGFIAELTQVPPSQAPQVKKEEARQSTVQFRHLDDRITFKKGMNALREMCIIDTPKVKIKAPAENGKLANAGIIPIFAGQDGTLYFLKSDEKNGNGWSINYGGDKKTGDNSGAFTQQQEFLEETAGFFDKPVVTVDRNSLRHRVAEILTDSVKWEGNMLDWPQAKAIFWYRNHLNKKTKQEQFTRVGVILLPLEILGDNADKLKEQSEKTKVKRPRKTVIMQTIIKKDTIIDC